ncbi:hypothetical protein NDU88_006267 [Pleurodeles waltl]|uniref:Uncharacterized protein n=1 Tax=Pleurodeles waltl TaxID=8319 RepID=A0AAV7NSK8_PLEWA|nr:hypothetical protein NDU88_006267 [Pleurodeles waltl]
MPSGEARCAGDCGESALEAGHDHTAGEPRSGPKGLVRPDCKEGPHKEVTSGWSGPRENSGARQGLVSRRLWSACPGGQSRPPFWGCLRLLEQELAQLEQDHQNTEDNQTLGHIHAKLLEFQDTTLVEIWHLGKYATTRAYGEGERPGLVLANLIRPNREKSVIIAVQAEDGSELRDPELIVARFCEY